LTSQRDELVRDARLTPLTPASGRQPYSRPEKTHGFELLKEAEP
jgi:hypothetical protein